jgi:hypothetical protein
VAAVFKERISLVAKTLLCSGELVADDMSRINLLEDDVDEEGLGSPPGSPTTAGPDHAKPGTAPRRIHIMVLRTLRLTQYCVASSWILTCMAVGGLWCLDG